ncbi:MAG: fluoride efflux transporter CrcB [Actinomycetota bacterium]|nr:fluoride efflux transporter CrcB [Actinomycetota bacterium]
MTVLLVLAGGAVGAVMRYVTDRWIQARHGLRFPLGTLVVNLAGCLIIGVISGGVAKAGWAHGIQSLVGTGFCGGLTTFSAFSVEAVDLVNARLSGRAVFYVLVSVAGGIGLAVLGWSVA